MNIKNWFKNPNEGRYKAMQDLKAKQEQFKKDMANLQQQTAQAQAQVSSQVAQMQTAGSLVTYQGSPPTLIGGGGSGGSSNVVVTNGSGMTSWQPSIYVPAGTAYQINGQILVNPGDQERIREEAKANIIKAFLDQPTAYREAYLSSLRVEVVKKAMDDSNPSYNLFGTNRTGYITTETPIVTLRDLEEAHATVELEAAIGLTHE